MKATKSPSLHAPFSYLVGLSTYPLRDRRPDIVLPRHPESYHLRMRKVNRTQDMSNLPLGGPSLPLPHEPSPVHRKIPKKMSLNRSLYPILAVSLSLPLLQ